MAKKIKHQVNLNLRDNAMTKEDAEDKIFTVHFQGTADRDRIIAEMMKVNSDLKEAIIPEELLSGGYELKLATQFTSEKSVENSALRSEDTVCR